MSQYLVKGQFRSVQSPQKFFLLTLKFILKNPIILFYIMLTFQKMYITAIYLCSN